MVENEVKKLVVGQLLEVLKITFHCANLFPKSGGEFKTLSLLEAEIFNAIKAFSGMPQEEEVGIFEADDYIKLAYGFVTGDKSREEATNKIFNWEAYHQK